MAKKIIFFIVIILVILITSFFYLWNQAATSTGNIDSAKSFEIKKGDDALAIAKNLEKEGIIKDDLYFNFYVWKKDLHGKIIAGEYLFAAGITIPDVAHMITKGEAVSNQKRITFPEGWEIKDMKVRMEKEGLNLEGFDELAKDPKYFQEKYGYDFLKDIPAGYDLEGFLFPDTYFFFADASAEAIIKKMLDNFDSKLSVELRDEIESQGKLVYEIVTLAGILEGEVKGREDKKMVSGLFWNRIKSGQALQSCATLAYILGENKRQYSYADTQAPSPYNTYLHPGLPPGPISNPGLESIEAAVYPTNNDYNYFLNNPETGKTVFSKTLEEHNANKIKNGL